MWQTNHYLWSFLLDQTYWDFTSYWKRVLNCEEYQLSDKLRQQQHLSDGFPWAEQDLICEIEIRAEN